MFNPPENVLGEHRFGIYLDPDNQPPTTSAAILLYLGGELVVVKGRRGIIIQPGLRDMRWEDTSGQRGSIQDRGWRSDAQLEESEKMRPAGTGGSGNHGEYIR